MPTLSAIRALDFIESLKSKEMNYQRRVKSVSAIVTPGRHRVRARPCLRHGPLVPPLRSSQYHEGRRTLRSARLACSIYRIEHRSFPLDLASRKDHGANRSLFGTLPDSFHNHCHERPRAGRRSGIELPPRSLSLPNDVSRSSPRRARSARVDAGLAGSASAARPGRKIRSRGTRPVVMSPRRFATARSRLEPAGEAG